jgi:alkanesulfonate monooxygenase SsuD/methylene tetrahydromethanopterin reductase-like flavin-dependent oxidoreductase (luciferase family)
MMTRTPCWKTPSSCSNWASASGSTARIRQRHLEHGVSAAAVFLAAASQRTRRIQLGTAAIPMRYESPFRLGEDLSTADVLSRGRLQIG